MKPLLLIAAAISAAAATCNTDAVAALSVANLKVDDASLVAAIGAAPEYCKVTGSVTTKGEGAPDGSARYDIRLPANWNGKFLFYGVGGLAGAVPGQYDSEGALPQGYAIAVTDTGHQAGGTDARWAINGNNEPDRAKIVDYFYRAAHNVTVAAKALVLKYYAADSIKRAYFAGCSNGGRMALQEAEHYPDDYDGIVSGAPFMSIHAIMTPLKVLKEMTPDAYPSPGVLAKVDAAVYAACDAADGVKDGLIQNPGKCAFDVASLVCKDGATADCLTPGQAATIKRTVEPVRDPRGRLATPGLSITDLGSNGGMSAWTTGTVAPNSGDSELWTTGAPAGWLFANHITQYLVKYDSAYHSFDFGITADGAIPAAALKLFDDRTSPGSADDPSKLKPFLQKGKKLLLYHGFSDPALTPYKSMLFYEQLADLNGGYASLQKNARLFMVPGMLHCGGGPGPSAFRTLPVIDAWVEQGAAPDQIIATKPPNGRTMPLCKFPEMARYGGTGDVNDAASWSCAASPSLLEVGPAGIAAGLPAAKGK